MTHGGYAAYCCRFLFLESRGISNPRRAPSRSFNIAAANHVANADFDAVNFTLFPIHLAIPTDGAAIDSGGIFRGVVAELQRFRGDIRLLVDESKRFSGSCESRKWAKQAFSNKVLSGHYEPPPDEASTIGFGFAHLKLVPLDDAAQGTNFLFLGLLPRHDGKKRFLQIMFFGLLGEVAVVHAPIE